MEGLSPTPKLFEELMKGWRGFALTKRLMRGSVNFRLVNPKSHVVKDYVAQNPSHSFGVERFVNCGNMTCPLRSESLASYEGKLTFRCGEPAPSKGPQ